MLHNLGLRLMALLERFLPAKTKRLIVISSLAYLARNRQDVDLDTMKKLNELMELCEIEKAMGLPAHLSSVIWTKSEITEVTQALQDDVSIDESRIKYLIGVFKKCIPSWLGYGETQVESDIRILLYKRKEFFR